MASKLQHHEVIKLNILYYICLWGDLTLDLLVPLLHSVYNSKTKKLNCNYIYQCLYYKHKIYILRP